MCYQTVRLHKDERGCRRISELLKISWNTVVAVVWRRNRRDTRITCENWDEGPCKIKFCFFKFWLACSILPGHSSVRRTQNNKLWIRYLVRTWAGLIHSAYRETWRWERADVRLQERKRCKRDDIYKWMWKGGISWIEGAPTLQYKHLINVSVFHFNLLHSPTKTVLNRQDL